MTWWWMVNDCGSNDETENEGAKSDVDECVRKSRCGGECTKDCRLSKICAEPGLSKDTDECVRTG